MRVGFWILIAAATLQVALASASLTAAAFSKPIPRRTSTYGPGSTVELLGRPVSLTWSSDRGLLIAAGVLAITGLGTFLVAARVS